jgi:hypothetical protein
MANYLGNMSLQLSGRWKRQRAILALVRMILNMNDFMPLQPLFKGKLLVTLGARIWPIFVVLFRVLLVLFFLQELTVTHRALDFDDVFVYLFVTC